tara:strand:+ start:2423 stop:2800 length:378 start_codon:yes stop_codon:yes gene_type:complete
MAFRMKGWSAFTKDDPQEKSPREFPVTKREARKIRKAKKKIIKAGSKEKSGPGFWHENEDGSKRWVDDGSNFGRKGIKAIKKLKKAGYTDEQIEEATGAGGWKAAMEWATDAVKGGPKVTKKDKK